jgi:hypothetical protein
MHETLKRVSSSLQREKLLLGFVEPKKPFLGFVELTKLSLGSV